MSDGGYEEKSDNIRQLASLPPEQLIDHLSTLHNRTEAVAPGIAPHVHQAAASAIQFLNSHLPPAGNELPQDAPPQASPAQKNAWLALHETVSNPLSVLDHVKNGTVTNKHIEALQAVFPELHQEMVSKAAQHVGQMKLEGKTVPYAKRQALGILMGQPLDSTMTPQAMQAILHTTANTTETQGQGQPKKASGVELKQLNKVNEIYQTPQQARQLGK